MTSWRVSPPPAVPLLVLVAALYLGPEWMAAGTGATQAALEFVSAGTEATALWLLLLLWCWGTNAAPICAWAALEAIQRPLCRLAFPLDRPPFVPSGQTLCEAAIGLHMTWVSLSVAAAVAWYTWERQRGR